VSVECGLLVATHLELASVTVRKNDRAVAGMPIGRVAASHVQLGARRLRNRHSYVDPLTLLGADPGPPSGVAPPPRRPEGRAPQPSPFAPRVLAARAQSGAPATLPLAPPAASPLAPPAASPLEPRRAPVAAWVGVALLGVAAPVGGLVRRRRRRRSGVVAALVASEPP
jgi:hypothetical protein